MGTGPIAFFDESLRTAEMRGKIENADQYVNMTVSALDGNKSIDNS